MYKHVPITRVGHVGKWQLNDRPVTVGDHDKPLEQIGGNHVVRVNIEYVTMIASSYTHLQPDIVCQVKWRLENGRAEGAERFLPQNSPRNPGCQHNMTGKTA